MDEMMGLRVTYRYDNVDAASVLEADQESTVYQILQRLESISYKASENYH
jgi:hypothetical protein